jgi:branched-chain amino acid transport system ATP-binding protein
MAVTFGDQSSQVGPAFALPSRTVGDMLRTRDLTHRFGGLVAISGVCIEVLPQEIFGIIGPNGAGKTTLFNLLSGTICCTSGEITFKGHPIQGLPPYRIARLGIGRTFQIVRPFTDLTVMENVLAGLGSRFCTGFLPALGLHHRKAIRDEVRAILASTSLSANENETARNLPLGLLRRLEIARALSLRPDVILLDESFSGLSHAEAVSLFDLVRNLREGGMTVIMIEHNVQITMNICDRIAVLNHGVKIAEGTPAEVRNDAGVVEAYLGSDNDA